MRTLPTTFHFILYAVVTAISHPKTKLAYYQCHCGCRFPSHLTACPKCGDKVEHSPERKESSPVPWYGSIVIIIIGIICWVLGAAVPVPGLDEAGRAMVYIPLGSLFGMSLRP